MAEVDVVRLLALGIGLVGLLATAAAMVRSRGARPLAPLPVLLGAAGLAATAAMSVLLPPIVFKPPALWALLVGGALLGLLAGMAVRVRRDPRGVLVQGGAWHLLPASLVLVGLQVAAFVGSLDGVVVATAAIVTCTAFAVAAATLILARGSLVRLRAVPVTAPAASRSAEALPAAPVTAVPSFAPPVAPPVAVPPFAPPVAPPVAMPASSPVRTSCGACGAAVRAGWNHCVTCGAALAWR